MTNNISSLQSNQIFMNTTANNIANVNTDGFRPSDTRVSGGHKNLSTQARVTDESGLQKSQTKLTKEIPNQIIAEEVSSVNMSAIKTQDEMIGSLLDLKA